MAVDSVAVLGQDTLLSVLRFMLVYRWGPANPLLLQIAGRVGEWSRNILFMVGQVSGMQTLPFTQSVYQLMMWTSLGILIL